MNFYKNLGKALLMLMLISITTLAFAQRTITGTITDAENGDPLIGANVSAKNAEIGVTTDIDGKYALEVPEGITALVFSYIGYASQEIEIGASNVMDIQLSFGNDLQEIVVIGYGEIKREDATGSIQVVSEKDFNKGAITGVQDLIVGKIAGVNVTPSADPGGGSGITIRGNSSLSASNNPLIVVDGIPLEGGGTGGGRNALNVVNPNDIESVTVLKDASATAIYGSRASGGVILITTKKGKGSDKLSVNYNGNVSIGQVTKTLNVLNAAEYRALIIEKYGENSTQANLLGDANTNWSNEIFESAIGTDHNVSLSGGVKQLPYRLSLGYTDKGGVLITDKFQRSTVGLNLNPGFLDNTLQININAKLMLENNNFADRGAIGSAVSFDPTQNVLDESSIYGGYFTWTNNQGRPNGLAPTNPLAMINLKDDQSTVTKYIVNGSIDYRMPFLPELRANLSMGYDNSYGEGQVVVSPEMSYAANDTGSISDYWSRSTNEMFEFYLNYTKEYNFGKIDLTTGYSWQHFFFNNYSFSRNTSGAKVYSEAQESPSEYYLASLFGRLNYTKDALSLTFTLRRDGSSRFSPDARWGLFPAAGAAYRIVDGKDGALNNLKLRLGYGVTGQQDIGSLYPYLPLYVYSEPNAQYQFGNTFYNTLRPSGYDLNIKWEETTTYNAGIDFEILKNRINGSLDVYQKQTKDLLNFIPVPIGTNLTNAIVTNIGDMENTGIELSLNTTPYRSEDFTLEIGGNATYEQNKITKLTATDDPDYQGVFTGGIGGGVGNTIQVHSVGHPLSSFFVYKQKYNDDGSPIEGEYEDLNGDNQITPDDRYRFENPAADWYFGINGRVTYKQFEFSFSGRAKVGNYIYNNIQSDFAWYNRLYNSTDYLLNVTDDINTIGFDDPEYFSDYFIQDGSFFRLDHVTLTYDIGTIAKKINNARVFLTVQNPLLISNYSGLDPEVGGIDGNIYPRATQYLLGFSANF